MILSSITCRKLSSLQTILPFRNIETLFNKKYCPKIATQTAMYRDRNKKRYNNQSAAGSSFNNQRGSGVNWDGNNQQDFNDAFSMLNESIEQMKNFTQLNHYRQIPETIFTVHCGEIRPKDEGVKVKIAGKVFKRPHTARFLEIKDMRGCTQLIARDDQPEIQQKFQEIPSEAYISVIGIIQLRPDRFVNKSVPTGACEIAVESFDRIVLPITAVESSPAFGNQQTRSFSTSIDTNRGITSIEYKRSASENILKYFVNRKVTCGELRRDDVGRVVTLVGWLEGKKHGRFLQLKDGYGITQIIIDSDDVLMKQIAASVTDDNIILAKGRVIARPPGMIRSNSNTGTIEMLVTELKILNPQEPYVDTDGEVHDSETVEMETDLSILSSHPTPQEISSTRSVEKPKLNSYAYRSHNCGELNETNIGEEVNLYGWLEFQRMKKFFTLRDGYGCVQIIIPDGLCSTYNIENIPYESIIKVTGLVLARPIGMRNETMATGNIEVNLKSMTVLNECKKNLPFEIRHFNRAKESLRLEYRYLDLRFPDMQKNLRTRSKVLMKMREYLINHCGFVEVETPTLFRRTPGGAQEFVIPTRKAGKFYSLVQSPQQFKQLLMVGAIDRYFQIAHCYRDETTRPDRQPEFTQLDIELSFTDKEKIMELIESTLVYCWPESIGTLSTPFMRMTFDEVMEKYGTDKPDIRFNMQLRNVTSLISLNEELAQATTDFAAYALVFKLPQSNIKNNLRKELKELDKNLNANLIISQLAVNEVMEWVEGPLKNLFTDVVLKALAANLHLDPNDLLLIGYGKKADCQALMGKVRVRMYQDLEERGLVPELMKEENKFLWVVDFPLFTFNEETNVLESTHHPFTAPHPEDLSLLINAETRHLARSLAYDLVLNGQEVGGGSIRIHDAKLQKYILDDVLKLERKHLQHMIEALQSGAPPHGGIALGIDRLLSIICNTPSIRDVIAFPKSFEGKDPLSKAPTEISEEEKKIYHIKVIENIDKNCSEADEKNN